MTADLAAPLPLRSRSEWAGCSLDCSMTRHVQEAVCSHRPAALVRVWAVVACRSSCLAGGVVRSDVAGAGRRGWWRDLHACRQVPTHHPPPIAHHPSPTTHHPTPITQHPTPITHHPSPITHHPSPNTYRTTRATYRTTRATSCATAHHPSPTTHRPPPATVPALWPSCVCHVAPPPLQVTERYLAYASPLHGCPSATLSTTAAASASSPPLLLAATDPSLVHPFHSTPPPPWVPYDPTHGLLECSAEQLEPHAAPPHAADSAAADRQVGASADLAGAGAPPSLFSDQLASALPIAWRRLAPSAEGAASASYGRSHAQLLLSFSHPAQAVWPTATAGMPPTATAAGVRGRGVQGGAAAAPSDHLSVSKDRHGIDVHISRPCLALNVGCHPPLSTTPPPHAGHLCPKPTTTLARALSSTLSCPAHAAPCGLCVPHPHPHPSPSPSPPTLTSHLTAHFAPSLALNLALTFTPASTSPSPLTSHRSPFTLPCALLPLAQLETLSRANPNPNPIPNPNPNPNPDPNPNPNPAGDALKGCRSRRCMHSARQQQQQQQQPAITLATTCRLHRLALRLHLPLLIRRRRRRRRSRRRRRPSSGGRWPQPRP